MRCDHASDELTAQPEPPTGTANAAGMPAAWARPGPCLGSGWRRGLSVCPSS